jgi:hypothetical protein
MRQLYTGELRTRVGARWVRTSTVDRVGIVGIGAEYDLGPYDTDGRLIAIRELAVGQHRRVRLTDIQEAIVTRVE